ncbi:MAG TPA: dihydroxyacetone kinase subunit DhaL [Conexibacter sp.]|nr:dihydroxyacetone kinase subunit DhaL [Conexibacter sp.]
MTQALPHAEHILRAIATTAVDNERYFCELDAIVGDGDFGYSLARGFEQLLEQLDALEYEDVGGLLTRSALVLGGRMGGTSGPIWGTAFLRAGKTLAGAPEPSGQDWVAALRAAAEGIKQRGKAQEGDKTLLDALVPATDRLETELAEGADPGAAVACAAQTAREAAEATAQLVARRGRASYAGERSKGSVDAGAIAVAAMFEAVSAAWRESTQEARS